MNLTAFRATRLFLDNLQAVPAIAGWMEEPTAGWLYCDDLTIESHDGEPNLTIGNRQYAGELARLEALLWSWADGEGYCGEPTTEKFYEHLAVYVSEGWTSEAQIAELLSWVEDSDCANDDTLRAAILGAITTPV